MTATLNNIYRQRRVKRLKALNQGWSRPVINMLIVLTASLMCVLPSVAQEALPSEIGINQTNLQPEKTNSSQNNDTDNAVNHTSTCDPLCPSFIQEPTASEQETSDDSSSVSSRFSTIKMDWRSWEELTSAQRRQLNPGCSGAYVDPVGNTSAEADRFLLDPTLGDQLASNDTDQQSLFIEANSAIVTDGTKALLEGDVYIRQGQRSIRADKISYDRDYDQVALGGGVLIRQPGLLVVGEKAEASTVENRAEFAQSKFIAHETHMRGKAESIKQIGPGQVILQNGSLTSCEPGSEAWSLSGGELGVNQQTGQGYGKHVKLNIGSVPIFYIPYMSFPIGDQRQSGLLFPSISSSEDGGIDIAIPYYWNLAENYDATITPRIITERGFMLETEFRHLVEVDNQEVYSSFGVSYLPNDRGGADEDIDSLIESGSISQDAALPHKGDDRWLIQFQQQAGGNEGWYASSDYTKVSDLDYMRDLGTSSLEVSNTTYLDQQTQAGYLFEHWELNALLQDYQVLLSDVDSPYRKVPQIDANAYYELENPVFGNVQTSLDHQYTNFDNRQDTSVSGQPLITGQRLFTDYRLGKKVRNTWGYFKTEVGYKSLHYRLNEGDTNALENTSVDLGSGQFLIDAGIAFEHADGRFLQTLEPRLFYMFREYENHDDLYNVAGGPLSVNFDTAISTFSYDQLYRDSRFTGSDRLDDANRLTIGLTSRWIDNATGLEVGALSLGQINHFRDRRIGLNSEIPTTEDTSELALNGHIAIGPLANAYMSTVYDTSIEKIQRFSAGMSVKSSDQGTLINALYSFARENEEVSESEEIDQVDFSFITQVSRQWALMGRVNYDFTNKQELETFAGLEYDDCCYRIRLLARRWLDSSTANISDDDDLIFDQGIFFEVSLKGLGGSGNSIQTILEDSIIGYEERDFVNIEDIK